MNWRKTWTAIKMAFGFARDLDDAGVIHVKELRELQKLIERRRAREVEERARMRRPH